MACTKCKLNSADEHVVLWNGQEYCKSCVESVSRKLYIAGCNSKRFEETIEKSDAKIVNFVRSISRFYTIVTLLGFGWIGVPAIVTGEFKAYLVLMAFIAVQGTVITLVQATFHVLVYRIRLPRTLAIEAGVITITNPKGVESVPLDACSWRQGIAPIHELCIYTGLLRGFMINTPKGDIYVHKVENFELLRAFFDLCNVPPASTVAT